MVVVRIGVAAATAAKVSVATTVRAASRMGRPYAADSEPTSNYGLQKKLSPTAF
jgi:hypothetical protein